LDQQDVARREGDLLLVLRRGDAPRQPAIMIGLVVARRFPADGLLVDRER
jgi:hypothetical protein